MGKTGDLRELLIAEWLCLFEEGCLGSLENKLFHMAGFENAILTRDNLKKMKWSGSPLCSSCLQNGTANIYWFFKCSNAKVVWGNLEVS
jgi:hypothetical protein